MHPPPPCSGLGRQCRELAVTLRVGMTDQGPDSLDHEATWLLGHTETISFGTLRPEGRNLLVPAVLHMTCRYLRTERSGEAECRAHGFRGPAPAPTTPAAAPRRLESDQFNMIEHHQPTQLALTAPPRLLPVLEKENPCASAPCRTADNRRGAACCRDLQVEIMCAPEDRALEALVRSRRSPYLCKITREGHESLEAEVISACGYLDDNGVTCTLHGRTRPDGRPAKPDLCSEWPQDGKGLHPGCVFGPFSAPAVGSTSRQASVRARASSASK
jgi:hypothetical protein